MYHKSTKSFQGVGFAFPDGDSAQDVDINVVKDWGQGPQMNNTEKVPSVISYSPCSDEEEQQFGFSLSPEAVAMVNTKLELDVQDNKVDELDLILQALDGMDNLSFEKVKNSNGYPAYTWKAPEEIVTDYLEKVFPYVNRILEKNETLRKGIKVDIVITFPVVSGCHRSALKISP
jgi:hypothetical protein